MLSRRMALPLAWLVGLLVVAPMRGAEPAKDIPKNQEKPSARYLRLVRDKSGQPTALATSVVRLAPQGHGRTGPTVDLIAAVHVGDKTYYAQLNRLFEKYDAVLYELVAPVGTRVPKGGGGRSNHPVSAIQRLMSDVLELQFQLEGIDYQRGNMIHADMSPDEFAKSMRSRGESVWSLMFRMMGYAMARQSADGGGSSDVRLLMALFDKNQALALKRVMAEQFEDFEGSLLAIEGPQGSTLIAERNKVALGVLRRQIAAGNRKLAIFYGGGHMPDFEKRLRADFGLIRASERWLTAWDLRDKTKSPTAGGGAN